MDKELIADLAREARRLVQDVDQEIQDAAFQGMLIWLVATRAGVASTPRLFSQPEAPRPPSLNEFLAALAISTHMDRVTAVLYHQLRYAENDRMTNEEILEAYGRVRERRPANVSDLVAKSIRKGHIVEAPERKDGRRSWQITPTGERYIESLMKASEQPPE